MVLSFDLNDVLKYTSTCDVELIKNSEKISNYNHVTLKEIFCS